MQDDATEGASAFGFIGSWREYAPIAFTNLLLTIVTLSIYSSWAKTRTRRYLWSRTRFIDDRLEYSGTGLELFIGKIVAFFLFVVPFGVFHLILVAFALWRMATRDRPFGSGAPGRLGKPQPGLS